MSFARPHLLVGWIVAIAIASALALAASAWTRAGAEDGASLERTARGDRAPHADRITDWLVAYVALALALVQVLGFVGWFRLGPVLLGAAACAVLGIAAGGWSAVRARCADLVACARGGARSLPLLAATTLGVAIWVRAAAQREVSWDGLIYHLTYPAVWLQHGGFVPFDAPGIWEQFESFPKGAEALYALAMLPLHADDLTLFVHPPLWLGVGCAIYATARRIGCSPWIAESATACAICCPALAAFISPANVEIPIAFAFAAATNAATRAVVAREPEALGPCVLALCLGGAIKVTSLAYLPFGLIIVLGCARSKPITVCLRHAFRGLALGLVVAVPWYANNFVHCDNPFYPAGLPGAQAGPAAGSLANAWVVRDSSVLAQRVVLDVLGSLLQPPWAASYPGPGWLYLFTMLANTGLIARALFVRTQRGDAADSASTDSHSLTLRASLVLAAVAWLLSLLYLVMPWNGVFWAENTRFLTPALLLGLLSVAALTAWCPRWLAASTWTVALAIVVASWCLPRFWSAIRWPSAPVAIALALTHAREQTASTAARARFPHGAALTRFWQHIDTLPPARIAYAVGGADAQEGWLFYPLFGSALQHDVRYVDVERTAGRSCQRRGVIRVNLDETAWRKRLSAERIQWFVISGSPQERNWIEARPTQFSLAYSVGEHQLYAVHLPR